MPAPQQLQTQIPVFCDDLCNTTRTTSTGILGLACAMPAPHGAEAATLLAEALTGPAATSWRPHLGALRSLTDRWSERRVDVE